MERSRAVSRILGLIGLIAVAGCGNSGGPGTASPSTPAGRAEMGRGWFDSYCASCHGRDAQGDGPLAGELRTPPADLSRIALRRSGVFPADEVAAYIDGRNRVPAHGPRDMPIWGRHFDDRLEGGAYDETRLSPGSIYLIVEYLRSIQVAH